ncbi:hypothetical protein [Virgibacillus sp. SK37]|uniref:hypothetical protein n=1 Tax=Virgibacillus sp. SK37 TaxID=403957 RepID=UPI000A03BF04|nr:hypothetical protein [Virgibacillus sp. SK37]
MIRNLDIMRRKFLCANGRLLKYKGYINAIRRAFNAIAFHCRWTLSAGMASAASFATLRPGSSAHAIPAGVAIFHSNQLV